MIAQAKKDPKAAQRIREIIADFSERDRACFDELEIITQETTSE